MTKAQLFKHIASQFASRLENEGFKVQFSTKVGIIKLERKRHESSDLAFVYAGAARGATGVKGIGIETRVKLRSVEYVYAAALGLSPEETEFRAVIWNHQSETDFAHLNYSFRDISELPQWFDKACQVLKSPKTVDFWNRFDTLKKVNAYLNTGTCLPVPEIATLDWRAEYAFIAARLANNPQYSELEQMYLAELEAEQISSGFKQVSYFLKKHTDAQLQEIVQVFETSLTK